MIKIGIRCDCGSKMGMGHIARQKLIYEELKKSGYEIYFFIKEDISLAGVPVSDMALIKDMDVLIIDLLEGFEYFDFPKKKIVFYDGTDKIVTDASIIFALNYKQVHQYGYDNRFYLGYDYIPMDSRFSEINRVFKGPIKKVLIMTSGVDSWDMPRQIYDSIKNRNYEISVLLSRVYPVERYTDLRVKLITYVENLAELFNQHEVMICTAGNVLYEAVATGLPCISFSTGEVQDGHGKVMHALGTSIYLGSFWNDTAKLCQLKESLNFFDDPLIRETYAKNSRLICDGKGLGRVIKIIKGILS